MRSILDRTKTSHNTFARSVPPARVLFALLMAALAAGCVGADPLPVAPVASHAPEAPEAVPDQVTPPVGPLPRWEGTYSVRLHSPAPCVENRVGCGAVNEETAPVFTLRLNESDPRVAAATAFVLTATWEPRTQAAERAMVRMREMDQEEVLAAARGVSPLVVEIPRDALRNGASYVVDASPDATGVFYEQQVRVTLELR